MARPPRLDRAAVFAAGREYVAGGGTLKAVAARTGLSTSTVGNAAAVLRLVPHLVDQVLAGEVLLSTAVQLARVQEWQQRRDRGAR